MKFFTLSLLIFLAFDRVNAVAQEVKIEYGPLIEIGSAGNMPFFNIYGNEKKFVHLKTYEDKISQLNQDLSMSKPEDAEIPFADDIVNWPGSYLLKGDYQFGNNVTRFIGARNKVLKNYILYAVNLDLNGVYSNTIIPIDTFGISRDAWMEVYVSVSPDKSKILTYSIPIGKQAPKNVIPVKCFDSNLNQIYSGKIPIEVVGDDLQFKDGKIDNSGNAFLLFGSSIYVYQKNLNASTKLDLGRTGANSVLMFDDQNQLYHAYLTPFGFVNADRISNDLQRLDFSISTSANGFKSDGIEKKILLKKIISDGASNFVMIFESTDSLPGQSVGMRVREINPSTGMVKDIQTPYETSKTYFSGNLYIINANSKGEVKYLVTILKDQVTYVKNFTIGSFLQHTNDRLYVFYNDFESDHSLTCAVVNLKDGVLTKQSLSENLGKVKSPNTAIINSFNVIDAHTLIFREVLWMSSKTRLASITIP